MHLATPVFAAVTVVSDQLQDPEVVEVASLLHDIQDWKYSGSETAGATAAQVKLDACQ